MPVFSSRACGSNWRRTFERAPSALSVAGAVERQQRREVRRGRVDVIGGGALVWRRVLQRIAEATDGRVSTATTSAVYTAAQQTADWGAPLAPGDTLDIRIFQLFTRTSLLHF